MVAPEALLNVVLGEAGVSELHLPVGKKVSIPLEDRVLGWGNRQKIKKI